MKRKLEWIEHSKHVYHSLHKLVYNPNPPSLSSYVKREASLTFQTLSWSQMSLVKLFKSAGTINSTLHITFTYLQIHLLVNIWRPGIVIKLQFLFLFHWVSNLSKNASENLKTFVNWKISFWYFSNINMLSSRSICSASLDPCMLAYFDSK